MYISASPSSHRLPATQTALLVQSSGEYALSTSTPLPPISPTTVLIRTAAVALNPADAKMVDFSGCTSVGCIGGYDFAGYVVALGSAAESKRQSHNMEQLRVGDRVCGLVFGANAGRREVGAFCEYVAAEATFLLRIPIHMAFEQAAGLGVAVATVGMALYQSLELPWPAARRKGAKGSFALVYGGSTACGTMAIQALKL
jgi:NADPH:quinone reductase-like Zn-dependent oxidoreductase